MEAQPIHRVLAIDAGKTCGWAIAENGVIVASGVKDFKPKLEKNTGMVLVNFYNWLIELPKPDEVLYERTAMLGFRSADSAAMNTKQIGVLEMFCWGSGLNEPQNIHNQTLKAQFAGNGHASKEEMCERAMRLGWKNGIPGTAHNHDEADACAVIFCILRERGIYVSFANGAEAQEAALTTGD